jgi:hypothetical protein
LRQTLPDRNDAIVEDLEAEAPDADDFEWPEPTEGWGDPLLDSTREYVEQVGRYKEHQGKQTARKANTFCCAVCGATFKAYRGDAKYCSAACNRAGANHLVRKYSK